MAYVTRYITTDGPHWGLVEDRMIYTLDTHPLSGQPLTPGQPIGPYEDMLLAPPVEPSKILGVARNYKAHAAERQKPVPDTPMVFLKPPSALTAFDTPIVLPRDMGRIELEAELAVVIGRQARYVREDEALDYVFGYTCANDVTARRLQETDGQWGRAKGFDTFGPVGPWISTDIDDPGDLTIKARLNGQKIIDSSTRHMIFSVPYLIAHLSRAMTLEPGDIILTGTPEGVQPLNDGDTVEIDIEGIGTLRNWVELEPEDAAG